MENNILEILSGGSSAEDKIQALQKRETEAPKTDELEGYWDVKKHSIYTDLDRFPDIEKEVKSLDGKIQTKVVKLTRIGLPYQKKIVNTGVTFYCGIPITYSSPEENDKYESFKKVLEAVKSEFIDADTRQAYGRWTECAEYWFTQDIEEEKDIYGFNSRFKIRCNVLTPDKYKMYPIFDNNNDLIVFSYLYKSNKIDRMRTFTKDHVYDFAKDPEWKLESSVQNELGLIPINYIREPDGKPEYYDVQDAIERLEYIYSALGESNNDFAFPILALFGNPTGAFTQKHGGRVLQFDNDSKGAQYVNNSDSVNGIENERKTLERDIHDFTDTPDISLSNMSGLGNILSGVGAEFLFLSAHQKVARNNAIFEPALKRRISIINAILNSMNKAFESQPLDVTANIHPFKIDNLKAKIDMYLNALNGEQLLSLRYVLEQLGIEDPEGMRDEIISETERKANSNNADELF